MNIHSGARSCAASRALMVSRAQAGWSKQAIAYAAGVSRQTVYKWLQRYRKEGAAGLQDRRSRPHRSPRRLSDQRVTMVIELRKQHRMAGRHVAQRLKMPRSTVARILRRAHLSRRRDLEPRCPVVRYERARSGELIHMDIKKLGQFRCPGHRVTHDRTSSGRDRGIGWEFVHVAIDDYSRLAYVEVLQGKKATDCVAFVNRALSFFADHNIHVQSIMTDNGSGYVGALFGHALHQHGIRHLRTRPYRPQTNGKAERFIQTLLREWAYCRPYRSSSDRRRALRPWLRRYNHRRPHGSLHNQPPISRLP